MVRGREENRWVPRDEKGKSDGKMQREAGGRRQELSGLQVLTWGEQEGGVWAGAPRGQGSQRGLARGQDR